MSVIQFPERPKAARTPEAIHEMARLGAEIHGSDCWFIVAFAPYEYGDEECTVRHRVDLDWFGGDAPMRTMCGHDIESAMDYEQAWAPMRSELMPELAKCLFCRLDDDAILRVKKEMENGQ